MSERMSSVEIEDVLSSIRRLVSEDLRPATGRAPVDATVSAVAESAKLILTPALRVVQGDAAAPVTSPEPAVAAEQSAPVKDPDWMPEDEAAFIAVTDEQAQSGEWAIPADVAALGEVFVAPSVEDTQTDAPQPWDGDDTAQAADWQLEPVHEARAEASQDRPAPDAAWIDAAEAEVLRQLSEDVPPKAEAAFDDSAPLGQDVVFDEQVLRDLVRDILREELQGALGERITRNVRKLVRAEIARAMALRDFE